MGLHTAHGGQLDAGSASSLRGAGEQGAKAAPPLPLSFHPFAEEF